MYQPPLQIRWIRIVHLGAHASSYKEGYGQFEAWAPVLKSNRCLKGVLK